MKLSLAFTTLILSLSVSDTLARIRGLKGKKPKKPKKKKCPKTYSSKDKGKICIYCFIVYRSLHSHLAHSFDILSQIGPKAHDNSERLLLREGVISEIPSSLCSNASEGKNVMLVVGDGMVSDVLLWSDDLPLFLQLPTPSLLNFSIQIGMGNDPCWSRCQASPRRVGRNGL